MGFIMGIGAPVCLAAATLLAALTAMTVYRAATQSIVYDEAVTYLAFLSGSPSLVLTSYNANNHVFFTLLARLSVGLFGVSELALRLPTVIGAIVFFWTVFALSRFVFGLSGVSLLAIAALSLNPFILDFLSAARGYGLALTCFIVGLHQLTQSLDRMEFDRRWLIASLALGLSACANLTFLFPALAVVCMAVVIDVGRRRHHGIFNLRAYVRGAALWLASPGVLVFIALMAAPLSHAREEHFFYGAATLSRSVQSLLAASLKHSREPWPPGPEQLPADAMSRLTSWVVILPLLLWICLAVAAAIRHGWSRPLGRVERFLVLTGGSLVLTLLMLAAVHKLFAVPYPFGRTGLYLIVLFVLAVVALIRTLQQSPGRAATTASATMVVLLTLLVGRFATEFNTSYYYDWRFDSGSQKLFDLVASWPRADGRNPPRIAASRWLFEPSLRFYRVTRGHDNIAPIEEDWEADPSQFDFFVVSPGGDFELARTQADVVYVHPDSGAALLVNTKRLAGVDIR